MLLLNEAGEELDKFEGYVFCEDTDMFLLLHGEVFLGVDMFVVVDMLVLEEVLCLPLLPPLLALPPDREVVQALGSSAFLRWQSTQYNRNFEIASRGIKAYRSATYKDRSDILLIYFRTIKLNQ